MSRNVNEQEANQDLIDQFVEIAGVDRDRARFYLETANFDLPLALSGFYEGGFEDDAQPEIVFDRGEEEDDVQIIEEPIEDVEEYSTPSANMSGRDGGKSDQEKKKKIGTLFSQSGGAGAGGRDSGTSDEDEEPGQAFYVGGSEKSGQQVLGPPKKKDKFAEKFFQQAQESGAEKIDPSQRAAASAGAGTSKSTFSGAGYRLGDTVKPSEKIGGMDVGGAEDAEPVEVPVIMRMWRDGYTIDDEPLRTLDTPADRQFLQHIMEGRLPPELVQAHRGKRISLEIEDHRNEEFKAAKRPVKAFSGQGHALGSPIPSVVGAGKVGEKAAAATSSANAATSANVVAQSVPPPFVDETKPITNIQVRLGNGERLVMKLNNQHTIKQLREFIRSMRPDLAVRDFVLMTNFPNKELTEESKTLEESNLLNAVIIQRFK